MITTHPVVRRTTAPPCLPVRDLPIWVITSIMHTIRACGLFVSSLVGALSLFSLDTVPPGLIMLLAAVAFMVSMVTDDDGMMIIRGLGMFAVASFSRAVSLAMFAHLPWPNRLVGVTIWLWLAVGAAILIRVLITWGLVVRPPKHRW